MIHTSHGCSDVCDVSDSCGRMRICEVSLRHLEKLMCSFHTGGIFKLQVFLQCFDPLALLNLACTDYTDFWHWEFRVSFFAVCFLLCCQAAVFRWGELGGYSEFAWMTNFSLWWQMLYNHLVLSRLVSKTASLLVNTDFGTHCIFFGKNVITYPFLNTSTLNQRCCKGRKVEDDYKGLWLTRGP